jgi:hypothetical protein
LAFIYSCILDTFHLGWRGSYKSSEPLPWNDLFEKNQQPQHKYTLCQPFNSFYMFNWCKTLLQTCKGQNIDKVGIYVVAADFFQRAHSRVTVLNSYNCLLQFPHKIKRFTSHFFIFINLGETYFSKLEKKNGVENLLFCTIADRTFVIRAYFWLAFIYSCIQAPCLFCLGIFPQSNVFINRE